MSSHDNRVYVDIHIKITKATRSADISIQKENLGVVSILM